MQHGLFGSIQWSGDGQSRCLWVI